MSVDLDRIIGDAFYFGYSTLASAAAGLATYDAFNGNYLSAVAIGALTSLPIYWASDALSHVRFMREWDVKHRETMKRFHYRIRAVAETFPDLREEMRIRHPETFR